MKAVQIKRTGGPEVFEVVELLDPVAGEGQILIRQEAIGLNFIDTYRRTGLYPVSLPAVLGSEAAGAVEAVGAGVTRFKAGDRAAYAGGLGAYAEMAVVEADRAVKLPEGVSCRTAAAAMLKGMTAEFLTRIWPLKPGDHVLVHAAAGGVGSILTQWLNHQSVRVIGTVGASAKQRIAERQGCEHVILYDEEDVAEKVRQLTGGAGVPVVFDSVGEATFEASLNSLAKRGLFVSFGNASGPVPPFAPLRLAQAGSVFFTRPTLFDYIATTAELDRSAAALFTVLVSGAVKIDVGQTWPLAEVAAAHRALEARSTTGASLLIP
jgi:NADPH2:quinone reductase